MKLPWWPACWTSNQSELQRGRLFQERQDPSTPPQHWRNKELPTIKPEEILENFQKVVKESHQETGQHGRIGVKAIWTPNTSLHAQLFTTGQEADITAASRGQQTLLPQDLGPHPLWEVETCLSIHGYWAKDENKAKAVVPQGKTQKILTPGTVLTSTHSSQIRQVQLTLALLFI